MKIVHPQINSKIQISDHEISVLVIEEPEFFYELLMDINKQITNFEGNIEKNVIHTIRKAKPPAGLVQILTVTEKQFSKMEFLVGKPDKEVIDTDERLVIL